MKFLRWPWKRQQPQKPELRDSVRISLMMRTAKLVSRHGEYLCTVRDVSQSGVRIGLFHQAPPDEFLFLELANCEIYPMQNVWSRREDGRDNGGVEAGYRFSAPIDVDAFIEEPCDHPRRPIRLNLQRWACLTAAERDYPGRLVNLSQKGACVESDGAFQIGQQARLEVPGMPVRFGRVRWQRGKSCGILFQKAFRMEEFARFAAAMQPYGTGTEADNDSGSAPTAIKRARKRA